MKVLKDQPAVVKEGFNCRQLLWVGIALSNGFYFMILILMTFRNFECSGSSRLIYLLI
jgi:hypothetical protein